MKPLIIFALAAFIFCAGFFVGHYCSKHQQFVYLPSPAVTAKTAASDHITVNPKEPENLPPAVVLQKSGKAELIFTAEEQAQLAAQEREAKQANIKQLETMIKSLQDNKAPQENIRHFQELKKVMQEELDASQSRNPK